MRRQRRWPGRRVIRLSSAVFRLEFVGVPDRSTVIGETTFVTYGLQGLNRHGGRIEYTYIVKGGVVVNVKYINAGNLFGYTQKEDAILLQEK